MKKEIGQPDFKNLPACAVEYIKLVIRKMKWRKSVRADVQAELIGHFEDALKDCKTNEEKETRAKELIQNFGDAKLIADLARRAKKRCRPMWIKTIIKAFQAVCIIIGLFVLYVFWFVSGKPAITTNYVEVVNKMVRPTADDSQNAAPLYEQAGKVLNEQQSCGTNSDYTSKTFAEANETDIVQIRQWLDSNKGNLDLIAQGAEKPYYWRTYCSQDSNTNEAIEILVPYLASYRKLAFGLRWRAYLSAEDKQYEKSFADLLTLYKFGKHQKGQKTLVENLVGIAIENVAMATARNILYKNDVPAEYVKAFLRDLRAISKDENFTAVDSFEFEKIFRYDAMQRCFTKSSFGMDHLYTKGLTDLCDGLGIVNFCEVSTASESGKPTVCRLLFVVITHQNRRQTRLAMERYYDFWKDVAATTPYQYRKRNIDAEAEKIIADNVLLKMLTPDMGQLISLKKVTSLSLRNKTDVESTLTVIALHIYKQEKGYWPENLQELVSAGLLTSLPLDPYSDKPLVYKKTNDGFTLYSVGPDFDDDSGKKHEKFASGRNGVWPADGQDDDAVFWPVAEDKK